MNSKKAEAQETLAYHNYDIALKEGMRLFEEYVLSFLRIKEGTRILRNVNPESVTIDVKKSIADMFFLLDDASGLHIEWQANITRADMVRFWGYNVTFMGKFDLKDVQTVILTRAKPGVERVSHSSGVFSPVIINLLDRDSEEVFGKLKAQHISGEEVNPLEIIYVGLYNRGSGKSAAQVLKEVISFLEPDEKNKRILEQVLPLVFVASGRLLNPEEVREIMEVIHMKLDDNPVIAVLREMYEERGMEQGIEQGRESTQLENASRALRKGLSVEDVAEITGLPLDIVEGLAVRTAG